MKEPNFYAATGLDRAGYRRKDPAWVAERLADPQSRFVPVWRTQNLVLTIDGVPPRAVFLARHEIAEMGETALLGLVADSAYFAARGAPPRDSGRIHRSAPRRTAPRAA